MIVLNDPAFVNGGYIVFDGFSASVFNIFRQNC